MPRKYLRKSTRASYTQEALQTAIHKINNKELSYSAAARMYGIPKSTLSDRVLKKTRKVSNTLGRSTAIPIKLESQLANCLRTMEKWGWGLSREEVLDITEEFVKNNKLDTPFKNGRPGPDWFISFRQRHNLSIKKPQPVEYLRKKMTDPFVIHEYFTLLDKTFHELNLTPNRIWNLDETSLCLDPTKTKVVGAKGKPCTRTTCGSAKENITVLTTVSADGQKLDPLIVFKGKHMYQQWMMENTHKYDFELAYAASKRGWIETEIFYNYMLNVIIPNLGDERPVLLLYDGHVSHVDDKVVTLAIDNKITILKLPPHTSHLLQPLDLAVFKSFKTIWDRNLVKWQRQNVGIKLRKQCFARMFAEAWQETKPEVIRSGFKKAGICPFDPTAVMAKDKFDPAAYARWQKHISRKTIKQPKSLIQLCIHEILKYMPCSLSIPSEIRADESIIQSGTFDFSALISKEDSLQQVNTSFEELLLKKVTQHPQNKVTAKLKRISKGAEVITQTLLKKREEIESNKEKERKVQTTEKKQKTITESTKHYSNSPQPGPSEPSNLIMKKKGKGIGKKSRPGKENSDSSYNIIEFSAVTSDSKINKNPKVSSLTKKCVLKDKEKLQSIQNITRKTSVKKRRRSSSTVTTDESIQMSAHSDSDILDSFSDILSDCDLWNKTDYPNNEKDKTEIELESKDQEIENIVKEIHEMGNQIGTHNECKESITENNQQDKDIEEKSNQKVTILSSVKFAPENKVFYKTRKNLQIDKDWDLFTDDIPKKKIKIVENIPKIATKDIDFNKYERENDKNDLTDFKKYKIGDTVLVRYYNKTWKYYAGFIENINENNNKYTISFYRKIGKKNNVKFVLPKRKDQDCVPEINIVKEIKLLQIREDPAEYTIMEDCDATYF